MIYELKLINGLTENVFQALEEIEKLKDMPDGTLELVYQVRYTGAVESYKNDRIMWLGYQLETRKIKVTWSCREY